MKNPLVETVDSELKRLGIAKAKLVSATYNAQSFGDAIADYKLKHILLRFSRDKGQHFLDVTSRTRPHQYFMFCHLSLIMGWRVDDETVDATDPVPLPVLLEILKDKLPELQAMFSRKEWSATRQRIELAEKELCEARRREQGY